MSALYRQVCGQILQQIASGELKIGDRLPPEADYAAELGISRTTLRLAFSELEASGVLQRRKRTGTQIISDTPKQRFNMATSGINELLSLGRDTQFRVTDVRTVRTNEVAQLDGHTSETDHWLEVSGTRTLPGEPTPFSVNRVYVPARFSGIEPLLAGMDTSVFRAIETTFNVSVGRVNQVAKAIACPAHEARILGLSAGAPVLEINAELYLRNEELMEVSVAIYDPDRFQVRTDVRID